MNIRKNINSSFYKSKSKQIKYFTKCLHIIVAVCHRYLHEKGKGSGNWNLVAQSLFLKYPENNIKIKNKNKLSKLEGSKFDNSYVSCDKNTVKIWLQYIKLGEKKKFILLVEYSCKWIHFTGRYDESKKYFLKSLNYWWILNYRLLTIPYFPKWKQAERWLYSQ